jgi:hypothetical protein
MERGNLCVFKGMGMPGIWNTKCNSLEGKVSQASMRNSKEASVVGEE